MKTVMYLGYPSILSHTGSLYMHTTISMLFRMITYCITILPQSKIMKFSLKLFFAILPTGDISGGVKPRPWDDEASVLPLCYQPWPLAKNHCFELKLFL